MKKWLKKMSLCVLSVIMVFSNVLVINGEEEARYIPEGIEFCTCKNPEDDSLFDKDATCTEYGYENARKCYKCDKFMSCTQFTIREHRPLLYPIEYATIKKDGKAGYRCSWYNCGMWLGGETFVIPKVSKITTTDKTYNGKDQKTDLHVIDREGKKIEPLYYNIEGVYFGTIFGRNVGVYDVDIIFDEWAGFYKGKLHTSWKINPKGTQISSVTSGKKKLSVKWKKQIKQTTGYKVQVATNKKFTKNVKTVSVSKKKNSLVIKNLKAKKNYYVRVRTYTKTKKGTCYSVWSKVVKKKTK